MKFFLLLIFLFTVQFSFGNDTLRLYYPINKKDISLHQKQLDSIIKKIWPTTQVSIIGYADFLSNNKYNQTLSDERAETVKIYLIKNGIKPEQIIRCDGKGENESREVNTKDGDPLNRRVDLIIHRKRKASIDKNTISKNASSDINDKPVPGKISTAKIDSIPRMKVGEKLTLQGLNFEPGRHLMIPGGHEILERLLKVMQENPALKIEIHGHICCIFDGKDGYDYDTGENLLSVNRAKMVFEYLKENGIDEERMKYKGFGSRNPKYYPEKDAWDQLMNRRVEIKIIEK